MVEKCGFVKFFFRQNFLPYGNGYVIIIISAGAACPLRRSTDRVAVQQVTLQEKQWYH